MNYMENVTELLAHAQTVDTRRSSPQFNTKLLLTRLHSLLLHDCMSSVISPLPTADLDPEVQYSRRLFSGKQTPEYRKIQDNYATLSKTLTCHVLPNDLANKLFAAHLIGEGLKWKANSDNVDDAVRINCLLTAVHAQIELNCTVFQKFVEILQSYVQLEELLKLLMSKSQT